MTLNPFAPTFRPQQRPKQYSFNRAKTLLAMNFSESSDSQAKVAKASTAESPSSPIEEQIHLLSAQLNQLQTYSESSIQQTTPLLQKFPLAHLKQAQYLHSVQLTVAKLHPDREFERLERQTLQLLVFQLQKDLIFTRNILVNQKTGTVPKQFSIDPPSAGTVTNPTVPETRELPRASTSQIILMGDSNIPKTPDLPPSLTPCQSSSNFQTPHSGASRTYFPNSTPWKNKQKMTSHVKSHRSQAYKVITPSCMTRFVHWNLAPKTQSYGGYHQ